MILPLVTQGQIKKQVFIGGGESFPRVGQSSPTITAGGAVIVPLGSKWFVRPAVAFSQNFPHTGSPTRQIQTMVFLGFKVKPYVSVLVGRGESFLYPQGKPGAAVPIISASTAWSPWKKHAGWEKRIGIFTPISRTSTKGWGCGLQLGYTW